MTAKKLLLIYALMCNIVIVSALCKVPALHLVYFVHAMATVTTAQLVLFDNYLNKRPQGMSVQTWWSQRPWYLRDMEVVFEESHVVQ